MEAMATGLKLKRSPARKPIPMAAIPAFATACCRTSGVTSFPFGVSADQGRAQLLRRRQGGKHEFAIDYDCRQGQHAVLDRVVHFIEHIDFAPFQCGDRLFRGSLQALVRARAATVAWSMDQLDFHRSVRPSGYLL